MFSITEYMTVWCNQPLIHTTVVLTAMRLDSICNEFLDCGLERLFVEQLRSPGFMAALETWANDKTPLLASSHTSSLG